MSKVTIEIKCNQKSYWVLVKGTGVMLTAGWPTNWQQTCTTI